MSETTIRIEDDDGFVTEWPWPDRMLLANGDFVAVIEALHDAQRVEGERPAGGAATKCPHCGMPMARRLTGEFCMNDDCPGFPKGASDE